MKTFRRLSHTTHAVAMILLILAAVISLTGINPLLRPIPGRDSGVFLYTGQRMAEEDAPYLSSWDHKGPALYFLNFLGVLITPHSVTGIFLVQLILFTAATAFWGHAFLNQFHPAAVIIGFSALLHAMIFTLEGGNLTESYALFFFMISSALLLNSDPKTQSQRYFWIGVCAGAALLLRPTNAALWFVIGIETLYAAVRNRQVKPFLAFAAGLGIILLLALTSLWLRGALGAFKTQYLDFNFFYIESESETGLRLRLQRFLTQARYAWITMSVSWGKIFVRLALAALCVSIVRMLKRDEDLQSGTAARFRWIIIPALLLELILLCLPERMYRHYLIVLSAYIAFYLTDTLDWIFLRLAKRSFIFDGNRRILFFPALCLMIWMLTPSLTAVNSTVAGISSGSIQVPREPSAEEKIILANSLPSDTVQIWQGETRFNFLTGRKSPTAFSYVFPLWSCGYATAEIWEKFLAEFTAAPPKLFIVAVEHRDQYGEISEGCDAVSEQMEAFYDFIRQHYRLTGLQSTVFDSVYIRK